jgi:hypothetical protein
MAVRSILFNFYRVSFRQNFAADAHGSESSAGRAAASGPGERPIDDRAGI